MNYLKKSLFKVFRVNFIISILMVFILNQAVYSKGIKIIDGSKSSLKLSEYIEEYPPTRVNIFSSPTGVYSEWTVPRMLISGEKDPQLFFYNGKNIYQFDYSLQKISHLFPNPVGGLWKIFPSRSESVVYLSGSDFARFNLSSGKSEWARKFHLTGRLYTSTYSWLKLPIIFKELKGSNQLSVTGLQRRGKSFKYVNWIMFFNIMNGKLDTSKAFHYKRKLSDSRDFFLNTDKMEYEVIDSNSMKTIFKGKIHGDDLLRPSEYLAVGRNRFKKRDYYAISDFNVHPLEKGFILSSYENHDMWGGVKISKWVIFNDKGERVRSVSPGPLTSLDRKVTNRGGAEWPVYLLNTLQKKMRRTRVDKIIVLKKDGSFSEIEMPVIEGIKEFLLAPVSAWFHIGEEFYYLKYNSIFNFKIGEKTGRLLCKFDKSEKCDSLYAWDSKHLMLTSSKEDKHRNAVVIRIADGVKISPDEYKGSLYTTLWKMVSDYNQSGIPLPKVDTPEGFKKYTKYNCFRDISVGNKVSNNSRAWKSITMFKVWGDYRPEGNYGDIGIVTARMKDKSSALIGINIADNRVLFSVPVMAFSGLYHNDYRTVFPEGNYLPFNVIRLNEKEALLVVLEKAGLLKIYMMKRP